MDSFEVIKQLSRDNELSLPEDYMKSLKKILIVDIKNKRVEFHSLICITTRYFWRDINPIAM